MGRPSAAGDVDEPGGGPAVRGRRRPPPPGAPPLFPPPAPPGRPPILPALRRRAGAGHRVLGGRGPALLLLVRRLRLDRRDHPDRGRRGRPRAGALTTSHDRLRACATTSRTRSVMPRSSVR